MSHFWCEPLGYVSHAPLGLSFNGSLWFCRQLQNSRLLALTQCCQERDPAIRKFQCVVMRYDLVFVDLPKDRCLMLDYLIAPGPKADSCAAAKRPLAERVLGVFPPKLAATRRDGLP